MAARNGWFWISGQNTTWVERLGLGSLGRLGIFLHLWAVDLEHARLNAFAWLAGALTLLFASRSFWKIPHNFFTLLILFLGGGSFV